MIVFSNAKINLGLKVLDKRDDGYHNIETCYYPVPYSDIVEIIPSSVVGFTQSGIPIPGNAGDNLCLKAYEQLKKTHELPPASFHLHKMVPIGAGLGGGSSNAAHCLMVLNQMFNLGISESELEKKAAQIGSDCPFFVRSKPVIGLGKGDHFVPIELDLSGYHLVIVTPPIHISSSLAYSLVKPQPRSTQLATELTKHKIEDWRNLIFNDFEKSIFSAHPYIADLKLHLYKLGAQFCLLSGSGSSVFGIFEAEPDLRRLGNNLEVWHGQL